MIASRRHGYAPGKSRQERISEAMGVPIGSGRLSETAKGKKNVAVNEGK